MGNSCAKDFSAVVNKTLTGDGHASKYRKTEMNNLSRMNSPEIAAVKESQVKYAVLHPQVKDILLRLSYEEIQILLVTFCFLDSL